MDSSSLNDSPVGDSIRVFLRVRPQNKNEIQSSCIQQYNDTSIEVGLHRPILQQQAQQSQQQQQQQPHMQETGRTFTFDSVAGPSTTQAEVFAIVGRPAADKVMDGYNACIFTYGQTGSGKTYTLSALMTKIFDYLFAAIEKQKRVNATRFHVTCSFLEIYQEKIFDLLDPSSTTSSGTTLTIREDVKRGVFVEGGLLVDDVCSASECASLLAKGALNRRVGETAMNRESSRSHSVFSITIHSLNVKDGITSERWSRFNLVDLAGSERQKATHADGDRLKEAAKINQSLSALSTVILGLSDRHRGKERHIHYRDSKLTFLLKDSLGGNSCCFIIGCISPAAENYAETVSTLTFLSRAKAIKNQAVVNEDRSGSVIALQAEIARLHAELALVQSRTSQTNSTNKEGEKCAINGQSLLESSLEREAEWKRQLEQLQAQIADLTVLNKQQERHQQASDFVLRLRDRLVVKLEAIVAAGSCSSFAAESMLREKLILIDSEMESMKQQHTTQLIRKQMELQILQNAADYAARNKLEEQLTKLNASQFSLTARMMDTERENQRLKAEHSTMSKQLVSPDVLLSKLATPARRKFHSFELDKWRTEQGFEAQLKARDEQLQRRDAAVSDLDIKLKQQIQLTADANSRFEHAERSAAEDKAVNAALIVRLQAENRRLIDMHATELASLRRAHEVVVETVKEGSTEREVQLQNDLDSLQSALVSANGRLDDYAAKYAAADEAAASFRASCIHLEEQLHKAQSTCATLSAELDSVKLASSRASEYLSIQLAESRTYAQSACRDLESQGTEFESLRKAHADIMAANDRLSQENAHQLQTLQRVQEERDRAEHHLALITEQLETADQAHDFIDNELRNSRATELQLKTDISLLQARLDMADVDAQHRVAEAERLQIQLKDLAGKSDASVQSLLEQKREISEDNEQLRHALNEAYEESKSLQAQLLAASNNITEQTQRAERAESKVADLSSNLSELGIRSRAAVADVTSLNAQLSITTQELLHYREEHERLVFEIDIKNASIEQAEAAAVQHKQQWTAKCAEEDAARSLTENIIAELKQNLIHVEQQLETERGQWMRERESLQTLVADKTSEQVQQRLIEQESRFLSIIDQYENKQRQMQIEIADAENTREALRDLQHHHATLSDEHHILQTDTARMRHELADARDQLLKLQADAAEFQQNKNTAIELKIQLAAALQQRQNLLDELERTQAEEARSAEAAEENRRLNEIAQERWAGMCTQLADLTAKHTTLQAEHAAMIGHNNPKQKIQHVLRLKQDNDELNRQKLVMEKELRHLRQRLLQLYEASKNGGKMLTDIANIENDEHLSKAMKEHAEHTGLTQLYQDSQTAFAQLAEAIRIGLAQTVGTDKANTYQDEKSTEISTAKANDITHLNELPTLLQVISKASSHIRAVEAEKRAKTHALKDAQRQLAMLKARADLGGQQQRLDNNETARTVESLLLNNA